MASRAPNYCRYGKYARVKINGKWQHLGRYGSEESKGTYRQLIARWALEPATPLPVSVNVLRITSLHAIVS